MRSSLSESEGGKKDGNEMAGLSPPDLEENFPRQREKDSQHYGRSPLGLVRIECASSTVTSCKRLSSR
jgi:hypothetical protein